jgi:hypothetical protein
MGEHESGWIEISGDERAPTASNRVVVGLAVLALIGGLLLALGKSGREPSQLHVRNSLWSSAGTQGTPRRRSRRYAQRIRCSVGR